jgi:hypothetical protein
MMDKRDVLNLSHEDNVDLLIKHYFHLKTVLYPKLFRRVEKNIKINKKEFAKMRNILPDNEELPKLCQVLVKIKEGSLKKKSNESTYHGLYLVIGITNGLYKLRPLKNSSKIIDRIP